MGLLVKEQINIYRKHIRQPQCKPIAVEENLCTCDDRKLHLFSFSTFFKKTCYQGNLQPVS